MKCGLDAGYGVSDAKCRLLSVLHERAYEFWVWYPGRPLVWRMKGVTLRCGYLSNLSFFVFVSPCAKDESTGS